jgi:hypothetical protein
MHDYLCGGTVFVTTDHEDGTSSTRCACSFINTVRIFERDQLEAELRPESNNTNSYQLKLNYFGHTHE